MRRTSVFTAGENLGGGAALPPPSIQIPKGGAAFAPYECFAAGKTSAQAEFTSAGHLNHRRVEPPFGRRNPKQKDICKADVLFYEKSLQSEYFQILCKRTELHPPGLLAGGAGAPYKRFRRRRKPWRRGGFAAPSIEIPEGGGRLRRPEPKKKDMTKGHVFLFGM